VPGTVKSLFDVNESNNESVVCVFVGNIISDSAVQVEEVVTSVVFSNETVLRRVELGTSNLSEVCDVHGFSAFARDASKRDRAVAAWIRGGSAVAFEDGTAIGRAPVKRKNSMFKTENNDAVIAFADRGGGVSQEMP
jgi:hypothetical protein